MTETPEKPQDDAQPPPQRVVNTRELMLGQSEILVRHGDQTYRLRVTKNGKLILQK